MYTYLGTNKIPETIFSSAVLILWLQPSFSSIFSPIIYLKATTLCFLDCVCEVLLFSYVAYMFYVFAVGNKPGMIARICSYLIYNCK